MAAKESVITFKVEDDDLSKFNTKHPNRGARSRVLRYILKKYLSGEIAVPAAITKTQFSVY